MNLSLGLSCRAPANPGFIFILALNEFIFGFILPGTRETLDFTSKSFMFLQTSCIARPTNNSTWSWPWWPWWPWWPSWLWLAFTACQEILMLDLFGLRLNVSWWIYISWALTPLTSLEVEPHNNGKEKLKVGNLPLDKRLLLSSKDSSETPTIQSVTTLLSASTNNVPCTEC